MNYLQKITLQMESNLHLTNAVAHYAIASTLRSHISKQFGDNGGMNRYPVSGGICNHWPEWAKDAVVASVHKAQAELDNSLTKHKQIGRHLDTWIRIRNEAGI
jgi:hypothetical protein